MGVYPAGLWRIVVMLAVLVGLTGCGVKDTLQLAPVSGMVSLDGNPLTAGTVYFIPDSTKGTTGPLSMGKLDEKGRFEMRSAGERVGAVVGFHKVRIEVPTATNSEGPVSDTPSVDLSRYNDPETSGLTFEVRPSEENSALFPLTGPPGS